jgi:hypothetical protein
VADKLDALDNIESLLALDKGREACARPGATMLVTFSKPVAGSLSTFARRWQVDPASGALSRYGNDALVFNGHQLTQLRAYQSLGRWFASAWNDDQPGAHLFELRFTGEGPAREVAVVTKPGPDPGVHVDLFKASDVIDVGQAIVAVFKRANSVVESSVSLDNWRLPGDSDPAVAVTYAVGCP